jgi:hypothetical protein
MVNHNRKGRHEILTIGNREHLDLPLDRDPLPSMGETEWDAIAVREQRRQRVTLRKRMLEKAVVSGHGDSAEAAEGMVRSTGRDSD